MPGIIESPTLMRHSKDFYVMVQDSESPSTVHVLIHLKETLPGFHCDSFVERAHL